MNCWFWPVALNVVLPLYVNISLPVPLPPCVVTMTSTSDAGVAAAFVVAVIVFLSVTTTFDAIIPPMVTVAGDMKFVPVIVIAVPPIMAPTAGDVPVTVGAGTAVTITTNQLAPSLYNVVAAPVVKLMLPTGALVPSTMLVAALVTTHVDPPLFFSATCWPEYPADSANVPLVITYMLANGAVISVTPSTLGAAPQRAPLPLLSSAWPAWPTVLPALRPL